MTLKALMYSLLAAAVMAERASEVDPQSKLEFSSEGHFVSKRPRGHLAPDKLDDASSSAQLVSASSEPKSNSSLSQLKAVGPEDEPEMQGCQQGTKAVDACKSLCYRIWCDTSPFGICSEFDADLTSAEGAFKWLPESERGVFDWKGLSPANQEGERLITLWYEDLKRNIPEYHLTYYMDQLSKTVGDNGALDKVYQDEFKVGLTKIKNAFQLRKAYDAAEADFNGKNLLASERSLEHLESAINEVATNPDGFYSAMGNGLEVTRALAQKLSLYTKMAEATQKGRASSRSTDEKVDEILKELDEFKNSAPKVLGDSHQSTINDCRTARDMMRNHLSKFFVENIQSADDALFRGDSGMVTAMLNLEPLIKRMKNLSPMFDGRNELPKAEATLEKIQTKLRESYDEKIRGASEALARADKAEALRIKQQDLEMAIKQAEPLGRDFQEEHEKMVTARDQVKAFRLLKEAMEFYKPVLQALKKSNFSFKEEPAPQPAAQLVKAEDEGVPGEDGVVPQKQVAPVAPVKRLSAREQRDKDRTQREIDRAKTKLRTALDACRCVGMPDEMQGMLDEAEDAGEELGGLEREGPCGAQSAHQLPSMPVRVAEQAVTEEVQPKKKGGSWLGNLWGAGMRSSQPAALAGLLLTLWFGQHVIQ